MIWVEPVPTNVASGGTNGRIPGLGLGRPESRFCFTSPKCHSSSVTSPRLQVAGGGKMKGLAQKNSQVPFFL